MQEYIISIVVGLAFGGAVGLTKYVTLWRNVLKDGSGVTLKGVYKRFGISYVINIAALFLVYFTRDLLPLDYMFVIASVAVALVVTGRLAPASRIVTQVKEEK